MKRVLRVLILVLTLDQLTKWAFHDAHVVLIPGVLALHGTRNVGAAFGILGNSASALVIISALAVVGLFVYLARSRPGGLFGLGMTLVLCGAAGNLIDRAALGYVIDFFELLFVRFAVFNVADIALTVGCTLSILGLLSDKDAAHA